MATNDFLPFAGGAGANVLTQADYAALAARTPGFGSGILLSDNLNKVLRQGTVMAAMLAQWIADNSGDNVVDDGTTAAIEASLTKALQLLGLRAASTAQTGVVQLATSAEAQALTDANKPITPATLKAASQGSNQLLATNGYQKLSGGVILQWGTLNYGNYSPSAPTLSAITLPVAFPSLCAGAFASAELGASTGVGITCESLAKTGFNIRYSNSVSVTSLVICWWALGY